MSMKTMFSAVLTTSIHGSIVILAVLFLRLLLHKAPRKAICWLWVLAGIRLLLPVPIESAYSLQPRHIPIAVPSNLAAVFSAVWIVPAILIGIYSACAYIHLRRSVLDAVKIPGGWESDRIETAFVLGFIKPKIYIPTGMPEQTRKHILDHERTHLEKGDHWIKMVGFLALAVHWFNPLVWISYILLCKDIEMACDERVVQFMELGERKSYSAALLRCSTNRAHYAACPVAFGEISVKYRIKSILNYRKPGFWFSLLAVLAFVFVSVCLLTSPRTVVEVPVDADAPLREISREDPADFIPAQLPATDQNPDWGLDLIMDAQYPTGGNLVYIVQERFAAASGFMAMKDAYLERWNGSAWEPVPGKSSQIKLLEINDIRFAQHRDEAVNYFETELDWTLDYGVLAAGDYRLCQTIESATDSAVFRTAFHIYREKLPAEEEAALERCEDALAALSAQMYYAVTLSETAPNGTVYPVRQITKAGSDWRIDHYMGQFCVSSCNSDDAAAYAAGWDDPFHLDHNRKILFPRGKSVISQEEITFCSAWSDYKGTVYQGVDTFKFTPDGSLTSVDRLVQTMDATGNVIAEHTNRLVADATGEYSRYAGYVSSIDPYLLQDSSDTQQNSPWSIFFRVDDDLLEPGGGEVWMAVDAVGVSNYTTDGSYWLEKKVGASWISLGDTAASWGDETITLSGRTAVRRVDWSGDYGQLDAGVYRMGKRFYNGTESIIQYAEFAVHQTGGTFGQDADAAVARIQAAIEKLQQGYYRVEKYGSGYSAYDDHIRMTDVFWKSGTTFVRDYYNDVERYSHSSVAESGEMFYENWLEQIAVASIYDSAYIPNGYGVVSDREIRLVLSYSKDSAENPCSLLTYRFDEAGNLTEIQKDTLGGLWGGHVTRYVITDTPESEIRAWVETKKAEQ